MILVMNCELCGAPVDKDHKPLDMPEMISELIYQRSIAFDEARDARDKLAIAVKALEKWPQIVYESLLAATAWMGIPERKRECYIKEQVENVRFIVDETLAKIKGRSE